MKYAVVILNATGVAILGWAMTAVTHMVAPLPADSGRTVQPSPPAKDAELDAVQRSLAALSRLGRSMEQADGAVSASLIGQPLSRDDAGGDGRAALPQRQLSVLLETPNERSAVIDGQVVRRGDHLPEGGRVVALGPNRVLVAEKHGHQSLDMPAGRIRIGTVNGSPANGDGTAGKERAPANEGRTQAESAASSAADLSAAVAAAVSAIQSKR